MRTPTFHLMLSSDKQFPQSSKIEKSATFYIPKVDRLRKKSGNIPFTTVSKYEIKILSNIQPLHPARSCTRGIPASTRERVK